MIYIKHILFSIFMVSFFTLTVSSQSIDYIVKVKTDANGDTFEYVTNDPMETKIYTLSNGLKVYVTNNDVDSRIQTMIGVRAGSAIEPLESTGLAHYLEHMMFKGSDKIGTINWEAEKPLLDKISDLFEKHRITDDSTQKKQIYAKIDSLSTLAAQYAVPNEYSKLTNAIGSKGLNASTSLDYTYYRENIPSNELNRWAKLSSERFNNIALRLFHTELETVFEEFNQAQDNDPKQMYYALLKELFKKHAYQRPTIGNPIDLKNPSIINIHAFFDTYYVPNNMFIVLAGNVDAEMAIPLLKQTFGQFKSKELPTIEVIKEDPILEPRQNSVYSGEQDKLFLAYRFNGKNSEDYKYVGIINSLLSNNGDVGLLDVNLNQAGKVHSANSSLIFFKDYGIHYFEGYPKKNQSLEDVQALIVNEIEKLKKGEFEEWLLEAITNKMKLFRKTSIESNMSRAAAILHSEMSGVPYEKYVGILSEISEITKGDIVAFANTHYANNYVTIFKRKGERQLFKVEKPSITPLKLNSENISDFAKQLTLTEPEKLTPKFIDYKKEFPGTKLKNGLDFYHQKKTNGIFNLRIIFPIGKNHDVLLPFAIRYFNNLGTNKFSPNDLKKEFYQYGITFHLTASDDETYLNLSGLNEHFEKALELVEHIFSKVKNDSSIYFDQIKKLQGSQKLQKSNKRSISAYAQKYVLFGSNNSFTNDPSIEQLKTTDPMSMVNKVSHLFDYKYLVYYSGDMPKKKVIKKFTSIYKLKKSFATIPSKKEFKYLPLDKPMVYFLDYDIVQAQLKMVIKDEPYSVGVLAYKEMYDKYYGVGLSSVIFSELREARALAYSSGSYYQTEPTSDDENAVICYISTQASKLPEAMLGMNSLIDEMKYDSAKFEYAKNSLIKTLESERLSRKYYFGRYMGNLKKGIDYDVRKLNYDELKQMTPEKFNDFFKKHINSPNKQYFIMAKKQDIDMDSLKQFGEVKEISLEDLFGY